MQHRDIGYDDVVERSNTTEEDDTEKIADTRQKA